jgi:hypothetical protein
MIWIWLNFFTLMAAKLYYDHWRWANRLKVQHWLIWPIALEIGVVTYLLKGWHPIMLIEWAVWWLLFDPAISLLIGQNPFYLGQTAFSDKLFRKLFPMHYEQVAVIMKLLFLAGTFILYKLWR